MALIKILVPSILFLLGHILTTAAAPSTPRAAAEEYDYIVVGSGPGGGPLASNLARAGFSVLLLEAGDQSVSGGNGNQMSYPPQITWDFFVKHYPDQERQMKYSHLTWRRTDGSYWVGRDNPPAGAKLLGVYYPRGATVGGSSMINAMVTFLPPDSDWNYVVNITGDQSWSATNMRKHFERIEHNNYLPKGTAGHGFDGFFQTNMDKMTSVQNPFLGVMQSVATSIGKDSSKLVDMLNTDPNAVDPNRDQAQGIYGLPRHTRANGQRYSSRDYILETINAKEKYPLTLQMNALATRVLFSTGNSSSSSSCSSAKPRATGVEYLQGKSIYMADSRYNANNKAEKKQAIAKKEVILSGGTFNSPQLLMLSGIGPAEHLKEFNIPVLVDSPGVGRNLMDNQEMPIVGQVKGGGMGGFGGGCTMLKTAHAAYDERDMFIMQGSFVFRGFWPDNQTNPNMPRDPTGAYGISMVKNHPQNHAGTVRLKSANPQDPPDINFNLYAEGKDVDMEAMKDTIAWARKVYANTKSPVGPLTALEPPCPNGPDAKGSCGKADEDWIIAQTFGHHPTSTCAIGADSDKNAVLDSRFRVRGTTGLRVVDASAFARIPGVFPVVATFIMSEKAFQTVLQDAKNATQC